ncbi:diguanylate cyclase (GGDEF) domain-containing protein [Novosphingobium sp. CF614]|uniref:putative bifunctional diguanylate cyclase/phosphodiesterase n=1 Tax=Novosphingobium sp. CF614 TaxID=1884364 RepID=UPI0008EE9A0D|nr:EAL domain-containing protein [Novosphingobium sp. CF614]SFF83582.1 diguanylate cyclase (GGDEF) domain-containing protein [Novosphingobium sp. CF614]
MSHTDKRRIRMFRLVISLIVGALALLCFAIIYMAGQIGEVARAYERMIVTESWDKQSKEFQALFVSLLASDQTENAVRGGNRALTRQSVEAPLETVTGSKDVRAWFDAQAIARRGISTFVEDQRTWLRITAPSRSGKGFLIADIAVDKPMLARFSGMHHLTGLGVLAGCGAPASLASAPLRDHSGRPAACLTWQPLAPSREIAERLPFILVTIVAFFASLAWIVLRRSSELTRDLIASEARARHVALHDPLTGLPNRALMFERLTQMLIHSQRHGGVVAVHCLDLDRFKEVNDTLGHPAGDELIRQVGTCLQTILRHNDTVARLGGDEFVILQSESSPRSASRLAERVLRQFENTFHLDAGLADIGCSIGVTVIADPRCEPAEALRQADIALYRSKQAGRNRMTFFEPEMDAAQRKRVAMERDLRQALHDRSMYMVYQPEKDVDGRTVCLEALLRWDHDEIGPLSPAMFIPLCEDAGLIVELGKFVMEMVFSETADWQDLCIAINVSPLQLRSPDFAATVADLVQRHGVSPSRYEFEITETSLLNDAGVPFENIAKLKAMGFGITLDDFGTGYSNLGALKRFSVDKIKIDRSFIRNLQHSEEAVALIDAIIRLARALRLNIVAEGVETEEQRRLLMTLGCDLFQGYHLQSPIEARLVQSVITV